ncbi:MAG TPA: hypothetical protein VJZ00_03770 [Thermoanaerobaculia bacterium]|nr:hypothetical protein [Thermoanaerobaculia bacterium]
MLRSSGKLVIGIILLAGCASTPRVVVNSKVAPGATIGIISFRDCLMPEQKDDCPGSGNVAGPIYARVLATKPGVKVVPLSRPVTATQELSDDAAVAYGREKNVDYVVNGEVNDYYSVAAMTFRSDRASVSVRLLRVSDGTVAAFQTETVQGANYKTPADLIHTVATRFRDAI